jgi:anti-sigma factor RsiW
MSHVDKGALHAYLDGALDEYPSGQARRIRMHLERCDRCAEALAEARRVRDAAEAILATPELNVAPPPLEELKRLARSGGSSVKASRPRLYRLGWAASVVLALGTGWMLRGGSVMVDDAAAPSVGAVASSADAPSDPTESAEPAAALAEAAPEPARVADATTVSQRTAAESGPAPAAPTAGPEVITVPVLDTSRDVGVVLADASDGVVDTIDDVVIEKVTPVLVAERTAEATAAGAPAPVTSGLPASAEVDAAAVAPSPPALEDRSTSLSGADARVALSSRAESGSGLAASTFDQSRARSTRQSGGVDGAETGSLVVPGLDVLSIVWREEGVTPAGVRVLQRLEDGGELELIHLPEGFEPDLLERPAEGVNELVVEREQGWLILRAALDEEALAELLRRLDEAPPL